MVPYLRASLCCFVMQSDDACNPDRMYDLISVVIHCGSGLSRGHYISIVKSHGMWVLFDDDIVDVSDILSFLPYLLTCYMMHSLDG